MNGDEDEGPTNHAIVSNYGEFPMMDPVVVADTKYEHSALDMWLKTNDKSHVTGSVLIHKKLVPNYGLM